MMTTALEPEKQNRDATNDNTTDGANTHAKKKRGNEGRKRAGAILLIFCIVASILCIRWLVKSKTHITTDNAFVETHIHSVSSRVAGTVKTVLVKDNQLVKKGDLLVELDPADYEVRMSREAAALDMAKNETSGDYAQVEAAKASVSNAQARLDQARLDLKRGKALCARDVIPKEQLDRLETSERIATSQLRESLESLRKSQAQLGLGVNGGKEARLAQQKAKLREAGLNLSYTKIFAPTDGYVTKKSVEAGNTIQAGQPLMVVVALNDLWVTANYKEGQLTHMRPGQKVELKVDTYPGQTFKGTVESIMAGTGAAFSLLPPENATGNYVKVVQRIPVKIVIDKTGDPAHLLRVGMSVVPTVDVERRTSDILRELLPF